MLMKICSRTGWRFASVVIGLLLSMSLHAQSASGTRRPARVPVTIIQVERVEGNAPFVVQRRRDVAPHDVILLRAGANPSDLSDAIRTLLMVRAANGDMPLTSGSFRARPQGGQQQRLRAPLPWVGRVLRDLHNAEAKDVPGHGRAKAVEIWLPPQRRRAGAVVDTHRRGSGPSAPPSMCYGPITPRKIRSHQPVCRAKAAEYCSAHARSSYPDRQALLPRYPAPSAVEEVSTESAWTLRLIIV